MYRKESGMYTNVSVISFVQWPKIRQVHPVPLPIFKIKITFVTSGLISCTPKSLLKAVCLKGNNLLPLGAFVFLLYLKTPLDGAKDNF